MSAHVNGIGLTRTVVALALVIGVLAACGQIFSRDDFVNMVKDKTSDEVASKLGKPSESVDRDPSQVAWTYHNVTFEAGASTKRDAKTTIIFKREPSGRLRVAEVTYP